MSMHGLAIVYKSYYTTENKCKEKMEYKSNENAALQKHVT